MAQNLNRIPAGLLSYFQIKSLGQNPSAFEDNVRPTLDLREFYNTSLGLQIATESQSLVDVGDRDTTIAEITIPSNEIWICRGIQSTANCTAFAANEYVVGYPRLLEINGAVTAFFFTDEIEKDGGGAMQTLVGETIVRGKVFDNPLMLPGGAKIGSFIGLANGTTHKSTVATRILYYKIEK